MALAELEGGVPDRKHRCKNTLCRQGSVDRKQGDTRYAIGPDVMEAFAELTERVEAARPCALGC
jgi:DNA-binding IclR family transcriptional regulator